ncbi:MAG: flagellar basal body P-ring formation chaperone FlgA [bacterium]
MEQPRENWLDRRSILFAMVLLYFGSGVCDVRSASVRKIPARMKESIERYVYQNSDVPKEDVVIEFGSFSGEIANISAAAEFRVLPSRGKIKKGSQMIRCGLFLDNELLRRFAVRINVRVFQTVVVSNRPLSRLTLLADDFLSLSRRETTHISRTIYTSKDGLVGLRTRRFVQSGEIVTEDLVEVPPLIARGKEVRIIFKKDALEISVTGVSREDGRLGETIKVKCLETNKTFKANVVDATTVIVPLL